MIYMPFTRKKAAFWRKKFWANRGQPPHHPFESATDFIGIGIGSRSGNCSPGEQNCDDAVKITLGGDTYAV